MDNLNQFLQPGNSPLFSRPAFIPGMDFAMQYQVQARFLRATQTNLKNFIQLSGSASATGTVGNGGLLLFQTTLLALPPHQTDLGFAIPYVALYQGTAAIGSNQIFPYSPQGLIGNYIVGGAMDYQAFNGTPANSVWSGGLKNVSAGNVSVTFTTQWKYCYYNQGSVQ